MSLALQTAAGFQRLSQEVKTVAATPARPRASTTYGMFNGNLYTVTRIINGLKPGVVNKTAGGGRENTPGNGTTFRPDAETLHAAQARTGYPVVVNGGGYLTSGNIGEPVGIQIINGVVRHDFEPGPGDYNHGREAIGFRTDGTYGLYSADTGDTASGLLADGVINTFGYGPIVVKNGITRSLTESRWTWFRTVSSARQILGVTADGDILAIAITGVTNQSGITAVQAGQLAASLGAKDAVVLDGGGSTQARVGSGYTMPSSDAGCVRPIRDFLCFDAQPAAATVTSPWIVIPYASSAEQFIGPFAYRIVGERFEFSGGASQVGSTTLSTGTTIVGTLPFKPPESMIGLLPANGTNVVKAVIETDGVAKVFGNGSARYVSFWDFGGSFIFDSLS